MKLIFTLVATLALAISALAQQLASPALYTHTAAIDAIELNFHAQAAKTSVTDAPAFSWAGAFVYDFKLKKFDAIVLNNAFPLHAPNGHATSFSVGLFGGATTTAQANALAGAGLTYSKVLFQEVSGWLLFGGDAQGGAGPTFHVVAGAGLAIKF